MLKDFSKERFDIIIQAGQSNAEGCGQGNVEFPYAENPDIFFLNNDFTISKAAERIWGNIIVTDFSLSFAAKYKNELLADGRKLLIVRAAVGGTGFLDHHWGMTDDLYIRMMDMVKTALELNSENRLAAFLWHQGETDAENHASRDTHYKNLSTLLNSVRIEFGCPNLPFIAGDFVQHWKQTQLPIAEPVIEAVKAVCADGNGRFVSSDGLTSNSHVTGSDDTIHFSREALYEFGARYYAAYKDIT